MLTRRSVSRSAWCLRGSRVCSTTERAHMAIPIAARTPMAGPVYGWRFPEIPNTPALKFFPTVEVIDRLYPPPGLALRYPIPIELTQEELELAIRGAFVTRVIYVEDPRQPLEAPQR